MAVETVEMAMSDSTKPCIFVSWNCSGSSATLVMELFGYDMDSTGLRHGRKEIERIGL